MDQENQLVVQSNPLIEAQYRLDLVPQKLLRFIISMIMPSDNTFARRYYRVDIEDLGKYLGWQDLGGRVFDEVRRTAEILKTTQINIKKPDGMISTSWLASYECPKNKGWIEFEMSGKLESELLKLKGHFTEYYLKNIAKLKHGYSIRLYELLRQCLNLNQNHRNISLIDLKKILGIKPQEYKHYGSFRQIVLEPTITEVLQKTDIEFQWNVKKEARKVYGILFYDISRKKNTFDIPMTIMDLLPIPQQESKQVLNIIQKYIKSNGESYVIEKINYTNSRNPANWSDYFFRACEKDHGSGYTPAEQTTIPEVLSQESQEIKDGIEIEIEGERYFYKDGYVQFKNGVIPQGQLNQMLKKGEAKKVE